MAELLDRLRSALADRYQVERELGAGGMATVYLADDLKHHRKVAIKVLKPDLAAVLGGERFMREIEIAAGLSHPHILPLHDSGEAAPFLYYVMPYVEGESLRTKLDREGELAIPDAIHILRDVADALAYAHAHGIVHRDIKPDNVMVSGRHAMVTDFGVSKALSQATQSSQLTTAGISLGTPQYMAPEQVAADPKVDHRADIYSLGITAYEILTGKPPFVADVPHAVLAAHVTQDPTPVEQVRSAIPAELAHVVMKCLEKQPADRWQGAEEIVHALDMLATPRSGTVSRLQTQVQRSRVRPWQVAAVAVVLLVAAAGFVATRITGSADAAQTVAVLPFQAFGDDPAGEAFAAGLADILTSKLTELAPFAGTPLWVVPSSELREQEINTVQRARRQFNVAVAITGSLQRTGDDVRLTLNLVDAAQVRQLRSAVIEATSSSLGSLQDNAVRQMLSMLAVQVQPDAQRRLVSPATGNSAAYELYVRGRGQLQRYERRGEATDAAIQLFSEAIAHDSSYALAYAGLGAAYWDKFGVTRDTVWVRPAIAHSRRALSLNDSLSAVWATLALISNGTGQWEEALSHAQRALALDPYNTDAYQELSHAYQGLQRPADAEAALRKLVELRPYYWGAYSSLAYLYYLQGRYEEAAEQYARAGDLSPGNATNYRNAGGIYFLVGRWPDARVALERSLAAESTPGALSNLGVVDYFEGDYAQAAERFAGAVALRESDFRYWRNLADAYRRLPGRQADTRAAYRRCVELAEGALKVNSSNAAALDNSAFCHASLQQEGPAQSALDRLVRVAGDNPDLAYSIGQVLEELGQRDRALEWIGRAVRGGYSQRLIEREPQLDGLRADPRFQAVIVR